MASPTTARSFSITWNFAWEIFFSTPLHNQWFKFSLVSFKHYSRIKKYILMYIYIYFYYSVDPRIFWKSKIKNSFFFFKLGRYYFIFNVELDNIFIFFHFACLQVFEWWFHTAVYYYSYYILNASNKEMLKRSFQWIFHAFLLGDIVKL